jgi:hypothetical protein
MHALGQAFGTLVYLLDALDDYRRDGRTGNFNALRAAYGLSEERLPAQYREWVVTRLWQIAAEIESLLHHLHIAAVQADRFAERLKMNLSLRLDGGKATGHRACRIPTRRSMTFRLRSQTALLVGKTLLGSHLQATPSIFNRLQAPLVFISAMFVGFAFPHQASSATSYRECMDLPMNLTLLGSLLSPAVSGSLLPSSANGLGLIARAGDEEELGEMPVQDDKGSGFCSGCCSGSCCDCGDCCECCTCCEC